MTGRRAMRTALVLGAVLLLGACASSASGTRSDEVPPRPEEPAGADFREDHPGQVATTGSPQLIEFFSYN